MSNIDIVGHKLKKNDYINASNNLISKVDNVNSFLDKGITCDLFKDSNKVYINPTESLILGNYIEKDDSVLTVLSSGDFALESIYHKCNDVLTFDINIYQYYFAELKLAALKCLTKEEYIEFFSGLGKPLFLSNEIYEKIKKSDIKNNVFSFFDIFFYYRKKDIQLLERDIQYKYMCSKEYSKYTESKIKELGLDLNDFNLDGYDEYRYVKALTISNVRNDYKTMKIISSPTLKISNNSYLETNDSFNKTKELIKDKSIKFIKADLSKINNTISCQKKYIKTSFNKIYLSNIPEYIDKDSFYTIVNDQLMPLLNNNGEIIYCYQGMDPDMLIGKERNENNRKFNMLNEFSMDNNFHKIKEENAISQFKLVKDCFNTSIDIYDTYSSNGLGNKDVYVRVKKK